MEGTWLTKAKKAYVYRTRCGWECRCLKDGWRIVMLHGDDDYESFWYPTFELAVKAIPQLWRY